MGIVCLQPRIDECMTWLVAGPTQLGVVYASIAVPQETVPYMPYDVELLMQR